VGTAVGQVVVRHMEDPVDKLGRDTFQALVMQALQLRRAYREVFILCDIKGYTVAETALLLGISEDSVMRRLHRARGQIKDANPPRQIL
jgi:RNA polymerase sigma factor (sigma-70 family)